MIRLTETEVAMYEGMRADAQAGTFSSAVDKDHIIEAESKGWLELEGVANAANEEGVACTA